MSAGELSTYSKRTLLREGLLDAFDDDAPAVVAKVQQHVRSAHQDGGRSVHSRPRRGACVGRDPRDPRGPGFRCRQSPWDRELLLTAGRRSRPVGELDIEVDPTGFRWAGCTLGPFVPTATLQIRGLRNRDRLPGLGMPLAASLRSDAAAEASLGPGDARPPRLKVPASALVRIQGARRAVVEGGIRGVLSVHTSDVASSVTIDAREIPLEIEPTAALAFTPEGAELWDFELTGFFSGRAGLVGVRTGPARAAVLPAPAPSAPTTDSS